MMQGLTAKLFGFLNRVWTRNPVGALGLRLRCDGSDLRWSILDHVLTTAPAGGTAAPLNVDLSLYTIESLALFLGAQPGYSVPFYDTSAVGPLSAYALYDQAGDTAMSNGDHLFAFTNPTYSILGAYAVELAAARVQIAQMLLQMVIQTASGEWLDLQGLYYAVPRQVGETDAAYAARIIPQVLLPKGNNVAIANLIGAVFQQPVKVIDVIENLGLEPVFDGSTTFNGAKMYNATARLLYGLFDIEVGQDILGSGDPLPTAALTALVNAVRDAGTQLRTITGTPSQLADTAPLPSFDTAEMTVTRATSFNGTYSFNGGIQFSGVLQETENLLG